MSDQGVLVVATYGLGEVKNTVSPLWNIKTMPVFYPVFVCRTAAGVHINVGIMFVRHESNIDGHYPSY